MDTASIITTKQDYLRKYSQFLSIEGGLSSDPYDRYNTRKKKYHTNRGVRYETFKLILPNSTYKDFIQMNDSTYLKIIKYHERVVSDVYRGTNKAITLHLIEELWACGNINRYRGITNLTVLYRIKENRYRQLLIKKPHLNRYKKGWYKRIKLFKEFNSQFCKDK